MKKFLIFMCTIVQFHLSNSQLLVDFNQKFFAKPLQGEDLEDFLSHIQFRCYKTATSFFTVQYKDVVEQLPKECIESLEKTVIFYFDGFVPSPTFESGPVWDDIYDGILTKANATLIQIKFTHLISCNGCDDRKQVLEKVSWAVKAYWSSTNNVSIIANKLATVFSKWIKEETINFDKVRLVGFSLGAQLTFQLAERVYKNTGRKFRRVTALEPALPLYFSPKQFVYKHYIEYLDVIHTNPLMFGAVQKIGAVDFYINAPHLIQPGCQNILSVFLSSLSHLNNVKFFGLFCSHMRVLQLYAESIRYPNNFPACCNPLPFCESREKQIYMGYNLEPNFHGICFLRTNGQSPFGKGLSGAKLL